MIVNTNSDTKLGRTVAPAQIEVPADYLLKWAITREYTEAGDETKSINAVKAGNRASPGYHNTWEPGVWH